jgi:AAA family ATP:ADP antiporter
VGGGIWTGLTHVAKSRYLTAAAFYLILYTIGSTFLYFEQADIVGRQIADRASRTAFLAWLEMGSQALTALTQGFVTGRMMKWLGVGVTLAVLPLVSIGGFVTLATVPTIAVLTVVVVLRRASNFALTNPATEVLFTVVSREDKYKAKNFIETFVYRSGDQIGAWTFAGLLALGLAAPSVAFVGAATSVVPLLLAFWLGTRQSRMAAERLSTADTAGPPHGGTRAA